MSGKKSNYRFYQNFKVAGFAFAEGCMVFDKLKPGVKHSGFVAADRIFSFECFYLFSDKVFECRFAC